MSTRKPTDRLTIFVSGMIAADPHQGGATWAVLQYLLGFRRLGHEVYFVEPIARRALQPGGASLELSTNATYFRQVMRDFGLHEVSALLLEGTKETTGLPYTHLLEAARRADLLVNISGMLTDESLLAAIPTRIYLDLDPAFNQLWHEVEGIDMRFSGHTHHVTVGLAVGADGSDVPTCGHDWITTVPPVVWEHWPVATDIPHYGLTTVANWRGYGSIERNGLLYGQKAHSFRPFFALPTLTAEKFMPALAIHPDETKDLEALAANGWHLLGPAQVAADWRSYRAFIQGSKAEFGIAKSGYVLSCSGWFSDRSVCYLASGRPAIAQDTGFSSYIPVGTGLFSFSTIEDVLTAIELLNSDYACHSRVARDLAVEYFDSDKVLSRLLERVGHTC